MRLPNLTYAELIELGSLGDRLADAELYRRANDGAVVRTDVPFRYLPLPTDPDDLLALGAPLPGYEGGE